MADQAMMYKEQDGMVVEHDEPQSRCRKVLSWCRENLLLLLTIAGVFLGVIGGFLLRMAEPSDDAIMLISFPGEILMRALKMLILPLIVSSLIVGVSSLDASASGKMGLRTLLYYFATTFAAIIVGIVLVISIHPGNSLLKDELLVGTKADKITSLDAFLDLIRNIFPENLAQAMFQHVKTSYRMVNVTRKRHDYVQTPDNFSELINNTFLTIGNVTVVPTNTSNLTKVIVEYQEEVEVRGLNYGNGINVLGETFIDFVCIPYKK